MKEIIYNKLVRDNIPNIIINENKEAITYVASKEEVKPLLFQKLIEELEEFKASPSEEELADILEVIDGIASAFNIEREKVNLVKAKKKEERGGFEKRIVLEKVIEG